MFRAGAACRAGCWFAGVRAPSSCFLPYQRLAGVLAGALLFSVRSNLTGDEWREVVLIGADAAPEVAGGTEPVAHQDDTPDLQVAAGILITGDQEGEQEGQQRQQQPEDLSRNALMAEHGQVLPEGAADARTDQQQQELAGGQTERPQRQHLIWQVQVRGHDMPPGEMQGRQGRRHRTGALSCSAGLFSQRASTDMRGQPSRGYCPCAAPLTRLATDWARMARARPPRATYNALLAWTRWFSFWLAVMCSSAAQAKKKLAIARAKAVRSLYRLVKKPVMLPRMTSVFQLAFTRFVTCSGWSSAVANSVLGCI